jgi:hypothetical protein|tara:strand:- start:1218 stop:1352 length:135 start_codon:yes stop_codon:yes gene_type:complete
MKVSRIFKYWHGTPLEKEPSITIISMSALMGKKSWFQCLIESGI